MNTRKSPTPYEIAIAARHGVKQWQIYIGVIFSKAPEKRSAFERQIVTEVMKDNASLS